MNNQTRCWLFWLVFLATCLLSGCLTTSSAPIDVSKFVIAKNGQECSFVITDPEGQMHLSVLLGNDNCREFCPKTHAIVVRDETEGELKSIAFICRALIIGPDKALILTTIDCFEINQAMFLVLAEKFDIFHIRLPEAGQTEKDGDAEQETPELKKTDSSQRRLI